MFLPMSAAFWLVVECYSLVALTVGLTLAHASSFLNHFFSGRKITSFKVEALDEMMNRIWIERQKSEFLVDVGRSTAKTGLPQWILPCTSILAIMAEPIWLQVILAVLNCSPPRTRQVHGPKLNMARVN